MKKMSTIFKSRKATTILVGIVVVIILIILRSGGTQPAEDNQQPVATAKTVEVISLLGSEAGSRINTTGTVESEAQATLTAESSGVTRQVLVGIGDRVVAGQLLVSLSSEDEQAALDQARATLLSQEARLQELRAGARPAELANTALSVEIARSNLDQAEIAYFNTDLQAYLVDEDVYAGSGTLEQPSISGTYQSDEKGEYRLSLYASGANSGYSFRYYGLETGTAPASSETPQPLGDRGLYIQFPDNFAANPNIDWVVPVPNMRSNQFAQAKANLEKARQALTQAENTLEISQEGTRSEQIQAQEAAVVQAEAGVSAAQARLSKKLIRAPFSGEVTAVHASLGELVNPAQAVVEIVNADRLQIATYVSAGAAAAIKAGDPVTIAGDYSGVVTAVASAISQQSGKVEVKVQVTDPESLLIVGEFISLEIVASGNRSGEVAVPLTSVKNDTQGAYVLKINEENITQRVNVETGSIRGDSVVITRGIDGLDQIIGDIRDVAVGANVEVK